MSRRGQVQAAPLSVNAAGAASLVVQVPWKPSEVLPPAGKPPAHWLAVV